MIQMTNEEIENLVNSWTEEELQKPETDALYEEICNIITMRGYHFERVAGKSFLKLNTRYHLDERNDPFAQLSKQEIFQLLNIAKNHIPVTSDEQREAVESIKKRIVQAIPRVSRRLFQSAFEIKYNKWINNEIITSEFMSYVYTILGV